VELVVGALVTGELVAAVFFRGDLVEDAVRVFDAGEGEVQGADADGLGEGLEAAVDAGEEMAAAVHEGGE